MTRSKWANVVLVNWSSEAPAVITVSVVGVGCYQQLDGQFVSLPPASLPSSLPPSSSLCAEEHKLSNTSTAAHISSVLQLSAPCLHSEGFEWADWAHNKHTHTAQFSPPTSPGLSFSRTLHPELRCQHTAAYFFLLLLFFFFITQTLSVPPLSLRLSAGQLPSPLLPSSLHAR